MDRKEHKHPRKGLIRPEVGLLQGIMILPWGNLWFGGGGGAVHYWMRTTDAVRLQCPFRQACTPAGILQPSTPKRPMLYVM